MRLFGLIGYPLTHSFSKKYFTEKFATEGLSECLYENFPLASIDGLHEMLEKNPALAGFNITIPYKEQIIPFLSFKNDVVTKVGACNCVRILDGKLYGFNTDTTGFGQTLQSKLQPHHRKALVLGTGGAAKAVGYVLDKLYIEYLVVSRSTKGSDNQISYDQLTKELISTHTLIINTTPLGMFPEVNHAPPIQYNDLTPDHYLYDLVYNPSKTLFLQKGEQQGAAIQNGHDMLIIQADESWKIWNEPI